MTSFIFTAASAENILAVRPTNRERNLERERNMEPERNLDK